MRSVFFIMSVVVTLLTGPVLALVSAPPDPTGPVLVITPPWTNAVERVLAAGGRPVGPTAAPIGVLAVIETPEGMKRLQKHGDVLIRDGRRLANICGISI